MFHYKHACRAENSCFSVQLISSSAIHIFIRPVKEIQAEVPASQDALWGSGWAETLGVICHWFFSTTSHQSFEHALKNHRRKDLIIKVSSVFLVDKQAIYGHTVLQSLCRSNMFYQKKKWNINTQKLTQRNLANPSSLTTVLFNYTAQLTH